MEEHITCDVIYICVAYRCDQGNANEPGELEEFGWVWPFIKFLPATFTGNKLGIIDSMWAE